ncbi:MAG: hypothetical protein QXT45_02370 [Candidatus Bilamarchaeaceae archaeon]
MGQLGLLLDGYTMESAAINDFIKFHGINADVMVAKSLSFQMISEWASDHDIVVVAQPSQFQKLRLEISKNNNLIVVHHDSSYALRNGIQPYLGHTMSGRAAAACLAWAAKKVNTSSDLLIYGRWEFDGAKWKCLGYEATENLLLASAAAHNLWMAYAGKLPGIPRDAFLAWRQEKCGIKPDHSMREKLSTYKIGDSYVCVAIPGVTVSCSEHGDECDGTRYTCHFSHPGLREACAEVGQSLISRPSPMWKIMCYGLDSELLEAFFKNSGKFTNKIYEKLNLKFSKPSTFLQVRRGLAGISFKKVKKASK